MTTSKPPVILKLTDGGPIQNLLFEACPPNKAGVKSIPVLAKAMGLSSQTVYYWIKKNRIPAAKAKALVKVSKGSVSLEMVVPFVVR